MVRIMMSSFRHGHISFVIAFLIILAHLRMTFEQGQLAVVCRSPERLPENQREVTVEGNRRRTVVLECVNSGKEAITWLKNNQSDTLSCSAKLTARCRIEKNKLTINNVVPEDAASYACRVRNKTSGSFVVHVTTDPILGTPFIAQAQNVSGKAGENVTVQFFATNVTIYTFKLHGVVVTAGRRQRFKNLGDGRLTIVNVSQADMGWITLLGHNSWTNIPAVRSLYLTVITGGDGIVGNQLNLPTTVPQKTVPGSATTTSLQPSDLSRDNSITFSASSGTDNTDTLTLQTDTLPVSPTSPSVYSTDTPTLSDAPDKTTPPARADISVTESSTENLGIIIGVTVSSAVALSLVVLWLYFYVMRRRRRQAITDNDVIRTMRNLALDSRQRANESEQRDQNMLKLLRKVDCTTTQTQKEVHEGHDMISDDAVRVHSTASNGDSSPPLQPEEMESTPQGQQTSFDPEAEHEQETETPRL